MYHYSKRIKVKAMAKTGYIHKRSEIAGVLTMSKKNLAELEKSRNYLKSETAKFIIQIDQYLKICQEIDSLITGLNKTNIRQRLERIAKKLVDSHLPLNVRSKLSKIKKDLEQISKLTGLDPSKLKKTVLDAANKKIYNDIMDEAERLYNSVYFKTGLCHINKAYSKGEIAKFLRQRDSTTNLKAFAQKVEKAGTIIKIVKDVQDKVGLALKAFDCYSRGKDLNQQQKDLKTTQDYKDYYYKIAKETSAIASELKKLSGKLPPGMRDYYEFIFTVAENTDKMAKVVYDYVEGLEKAMKELDKELKKNAFGSNRPTFWNQYKINNRKGANPNDDNVRSFERLKD